MSKFSDEIRSISPIAWVIAVLGAVCTFFLVYFLAIPHDLETRHWPPAGQLLFSIWPPVLIFCWVLLIGYINADAQRRGMRYVMWTFLAIFIPNFIGVILYFVLRDPLLVRCPQCGAPGRVNFVFCPQCGATLCPVCPGCRRSVDPAWRRCAYCGMDLAPTASAPAPQSAPGR